MGTVIALTVSRNTKHRLGECNVFLGKSQDVASGVSSFLQRAEFPASRGVLFLTRPETAWGDEVSL
jgi:hypothetical protein